MIFPLMTIYLTEKTTKEELIDSFSKGHVFAAKSILLEQLLTLNQVLEISEIFSPSGENGRNWHAFTYTW